MLIARFASHKNSIIKVIRTEKNSSPFEVCLKDDFETKRKKSIYFGKNFQIILLTSKLRCLYKTVQPPYLPSCCTQRCCTHMQGEIKFIFSEWSRNSLSKKKVHSQCSEKSMKSRKKEKIIWFYLFQTPVVKFVTRPCGILACSKYFLHQFIPK